jgi:outer membrane protein TolC
VLFEAYKAYNEWLTAYNENVIIGNYISNIQARLNLTSITYQNGDKSLGDTIEVYTQLQTFKIERENLIQELINKSLQLSSYLWDKNGQAYIISESYIPDVNFTKTTLNRLLPAFVGENNDWLKLYNFKNDVLKLEERLALQSQLPSLNLQAKSYGLENAFPLISSKNLFSQNFFVGVNFKYPLLAREAKSKVQLTRIKLTENELKRTQKVWDLQLKYYTAVNEWTRLNNQLTELESLKNNLNKLLELENLRFTQGESSVFVINSRENKLFDTQIKENEILKKLVETRLKMDWINIAY